MTCGIYLLRFNNTSEVYIGQSSNITLRFKQHLQRMRKGTNSVKLNEAYKQYGEPLLEIVTECKEAELNTFENEIIEIFNSVSEGFNTLDKAEDMPKSAGTQHGRSVHNKEDILKVVRLLASTDMPTQKEISSVTAVPASTISSIANGTTHQWIAEEMPHEWQIISTRPAYRNGAKDRGTKYPSIYSPDGIEYTVTNATKFAKEHSLSQGNLCSVLRGERPHHKGWKLHKGELS